MVLLLCEVPLTVCRARHATSRVGSILISLVSLGFPIVDFEVRDWDRTFEQVSLDMSKLKRFVHVSHS
jgi:hypothetical protein